jgi:hypothetical protein
MWLDAMFQQCAYIGYQMWVWLRYESGIHPLLFLGVVIVIISAVLLYKAEVRSK